MFRFRDHQNWRCCFHDHFKATNLQKLQIFKHSELSFSDPPKRLLNWESEENTLKELPKRPFLKRRLWCCLPDNGDEAVKNTFKIYIYIYICIFQFHGLPPPLPLWNGLALWEGVGVIYGSVTGRTKWKDWYQARYDWSMYAGVSSENVCLDQRQKTRSSWIM